MRMFESATLCARAGQQIAKTPAMATARERIFTLLERKCSQAFEEDCIFLPDRTFKMIFAVKAYNMRATNAPGFARDAGAVFENTRAWRFTASSQTASDTHLN